MKKIKFDIGDWVETKAIVHFDYDYPESLKRQHKMKRKMFRQKKVTKKGRVVGMCYRNIGERNNPISIYTEGWNEQATFTVTKRILIYLIKEGMINKPFECLEKDLKRTPPENFPFCKSHKVIWTEEERQKMSEYSKCFPRDSKGRWTK